MTTTPAPEPNPLSEATADPLGDATGTQPREVSAPVQRKKVSVSSKTGYAWSGLVAGAVILIVLLIFILQNLDQVPVSLFFWDFTLPLGVTVLLSVIIGALLMSLVGGLRILQLRRLAKHPR
ncbi:lipopolysaccharide assembly LapA domain-containing protein [Nocardia jiangsuensis]|uniref:Lipopolysaccharide assembly LapA domain-containing protein n=1 Tax=Nocardia jiangsuensis TaxID=1691563 RepID=A0ABV8DN95_9NOCA